MCRPGALKEPLPFQRLKQGAKYPGAILSLQHSKRCGRTAPPITEAAAPGSSRAGSQATVPLPGAPAGTRQGQEPGAPGVDARTKR